MDSFSNEGTWVWYAECVPKDHGVAQDAVWIVQSNLIEAGPNIKSILRRFKRRRPSRVNLWQVCKVKDAMDLLSLLNPAYLVLSLVILCAFYVWYR